MRTYGKCNNSHAPSTGLSGIFSFHRNTIFETRHEISNNVVHETSKGSDHPVHMRSLVRGFASRLNVL